MKLEDLSTTEFFENPYCLYEQFRRKGPLIQAGAKIALAGGYALVEALLLDRRMTKSLTAGVRARYGDKGISQPVFQAFERMLLNMNPPTHTRLRALLIKAFSARHLESMREVSQNTVNRLIDKFARRQEVDLVKNFATPLPVEIICRLLDIPSADGLKLSAAASTMTDALDVAPLGLRELKLASLKTRELEDYFRPVVQARRVKRGGDLISALIAAEVDGESMTDEEIVSNALLLFAAGHETTSNMLCNSLVALFRHPDQLAILKSDMSLVSRAVDECMRYDSSVQAVPRIAQADITVDGINIQEGTVVYMMLGAANRDPARFENPDRLDIRRANAGKLISFSAGIHYCIGARLAHMELSIALQTLRMRSISDALVATDDI